MQKELHEPQFTTHIRTCYQCGTPMETLFDCYSTCDNCRGEKYYDIQQYKPDLTKTVPH